MTDFLNFTVGSETAEFKKLPPMEDCTFTLTTIEPAASKDGIPYDPPALFFQFRLDDYDEDAEDLDGNTLGTEWEGYLHREKVNLPKPGTNPGPNSNLYKLAKRLLGRNIEEGENINLKPLVGKQYKADVELENQKEPDPNKQGAFRNKRVARTGADGTQTQEYVMKPTIMNTVKPMKARKQRPAPEPVADTEEFDWDADDK